MSPEEIVDAMDVEWYKSNTRDTFVDVADQLLNAYMNPEVITEMLERLYSAVGGEYGE